MTSTDPAVIELEQKLSQMPEPTFSLVYQMINSGDAYEYDRIGRFAAAWLRPHLSPDAASDAGLDTTIRSAVDRENERRGRNEVLDTIQRTADDMIAEVFAMLDITVHDLVEEHQPLLTPQEIDNALVLAAHAALRRAIQARTPAQYQDQDAQDGSDTDAAIVAPIRTTQDAAEAESQDQDAQEQDPSEAGAPDPTMMDALNELSDYIQSTTPHPNDVPFDPSIDPHLRNNFRIAWSGFLNATAALYDAWQPELEDMIDHHAYDEAFGAVSFDEFLARAASVLRDPDDALTYEPPPTTPTPPATTADPTFTVARTFYTITLRDFLALRTSQCQEIVRSLKLLTGDDLIYGAMTDLEWRTSAVNLAASLDQDTWHEFVLAVRRAKEASRT